MDMPKTPAAQAAEQPEIIIRGTGVSNGLVIGRAYCVQLSQDLPIPAHGTIGDEQIPGEMQRVMVAIERSREQLRQTMSEVEESLGNDQALVFDCYLLILDDAALTERIETMMREHHLCAELACRQALAAYSDELAQGESEYLRARAKDIRDLGERLVSNLLGVDVDLDLSSLPDGCILVANDLTPSETVHLDARHVRAFVTRDGSRTSHTAILSSAMGIPAIVAIQEQVKQIETGMEMALDGANGLIYLHPSEETKRDILQRQQVEQRLQRQLSDESNAPVETLDGYQACLVANVEQFSEALTIRERFHVGIGLFRTEFLFINGMDLQSEERQFEVYRDTAEAVRPYSVIFRTLDVGGDKLIKRMKMQHENNPFMGMRAIRFSLLRPDIFKMQLRAILRASAYGKVRVMFPMISTYEELDEALRLLDEVKLELKHQGIAFNDSLDVGCMIEVPAAALLAERLVKRLTFFSLGTNDLVQYSLGVDRTNPSVGYLYQPMHPSIIRMMKHVVDVAYAHDRWVSVCGEMAGDCLCAPLILGLGIHELSMSTNALARISKVIRSIRMYEAELLVNSALECERAEDVHRLCRELLQRACPELLV